MKAKVVNIPAIPRTAKRSAIVIPSHGLTFLTGQYGKARPGHQFRESEPRIPNTVLTYPGVRIDFEAARR